MHLTRWGPAPSPLRSPLCLLHGWLDVGDTFQFIVDAFKKDWPIVAPDWRGFGRSEWPQEGYGFPDYLGDFDALLEQISPESPVRIVGHSMGGNIANLYAGLRPERVRSVVNLEGFGLPRTSAADSPRRMRKWLDQIKAPALEKNYNSFEQLTAIIQFRYPTLFAGRRRVCGARVGNSRRRRPGAAGGRSAPSLGESHHLQTGGRRSNVARNSCTAAHDAG